MSTESRREERAHSIRTVLIASVAAAIAAIVTSYFWRSGTPIAAAVTPVIVAIVSELLHRPTEKIAQRVTSERFALPGSRAANQPRRPSEARLEQLGRTGASEPPPEAPTRKLPEEADRPATTVYTSEGRGRGKIHPRFVIVTALIAFAIAAAVITLPELLGGESLGSSDSKTTLFGGSSRDAKDKDDDREQTETRERTAPDRTATEPGSRDERPEPKRPQAAPAPQDAETGTQTTGTDSTSTQPR